MSGSFSTTQELVPVVERILQDRGKDGAGAGVLASLLGTIVDAQVGVPGASGVALGLLKALVPGLGDGHLGIPSSGAATGLAVPQTAGAGAPVFAMQLQGGGQLALLSTRPLLPGEAAGLLSIITPVLKLLEGEAAAPAVRRS